MIGDQDLIALLHRADWTRLWLSGEVRGVDEPRFSVFGWSDSRRPDGDEDTRFPVTPSSPEPAGERGWTLLLAPGKRYREELPGGREIRGCDGERIWLWDGDEPARPVLAARPLRSRDRGRHHGLRASRHPRRGDAARSA
jgi:hypothetical protein